MLLRALLTLAAGATLLIWSLKRVREFSPLGPILQLVGACGVLGVAGAHLCEALRLLPGMGWGAPHSIGHYVDLVSALAAVTLLPVGLLVTRLRDAPG